MIIVMKANSSKEDADELLALIESKGLKPLYLPGAERTVLGALGDERILAQLHLEKHPSVDEVKAILSPYKKVSRELHPEDTIVSVGSCRFSPDKFVVIAGSKHLNSEQLLRQLCETVSQSGVKLLRTEFFSGNAGSTAIHPLQNQDEEHIAAITKKCGLGVLAEVSDVADIESLQGKVDMLLIDSASMMNPRLLVAAGQSGLPVILKRAISATIEEFLVAAERIVNTGNEQVVLCESGIRSFETATKTTLDLSAVALIKQRSHLPIIVDPSQATGVKALIVPMSKAAIAAGADGLMLDVHTQPDETLSDSRNYLMLTEFEELMQQIKPYIVASGRSFS